MIVSCGGVGYRDADTKFQGRQDLLAYAKERAIPIAMDVGNRPPYSMVSPSPSLCLSFLCLRLRQGGRGHA